MTRPVLGKKAKAMLKELGEPKKTKVIKPKREMSDEAKEAAGERLAAARLARGVKGDAAIHTTLRDIDVEDALHWRKVKVWIKSCTEELKGLKMYKDSNKADQRLEYQTLTNYISNLKKYLSTGVYFDHRYGEKREGVMVQMCLTMAYWEPGVPKRSVGCYYCDIGNVWSKDMAESMGCTLDGKELLNA